MPEVMRDEQKKAYIRKVYEEDGRQGVRGKNMPRTWAAFFKEVDSSKKAFNCITDTFDRDGRETYRYIGDFRFLSVPHTEDGLEYPRGRKIQNVGRVTLNELKGLGVYYGVAFFNDTHQEAEAEIKVSDEEFQAYLDDQRALFESAGIEVDPAEFTLSSNSVAPVQLAPVVIEGEVSPRDQYIREKIAAKLQEFDQNELEILLTPITPDHDNRFIKELASLDIPELKLPIQVVVGDMLGQNIIDVLDEDKMDDVEQLVSGIYNFPCNLQAVYGSEYDDPEAAKAKEEAEAAINRVLTHYETNYGVIRPTSP